MAIFIIILIGLVQGLAEFLPISSSGHLYVLYDIFNITNNTLLLSIIMHMATLMAVIIVYFEDIKLLIKNPFCKTNKLILTATIPTIIIVLIFEFLLDNIFGGNFVIIGFLITAIILIISEKLSRPDISTTNILNMNISYKTAVIIGISQGVASIPGISRSGSTIATALICNVNKNDATKFSFLLSIPIILASFLYELLKIKEASFEFGTIELFVGFITAFFAGLFAIKYMINYIKNKKLYVFSIYLFILSGILILKGIILN